MTLREAKDHVASEIIYARPSNYRQYKGWEDWTTYFNPSTKERDEAWERASTLFAKSCWDGACEAMERGTYISYGGCNYEGEKEAYISFGKPEFEDWINDKKI